MNVTELPSIGIRERVDIDVRGRCIFKRLSFKYPSIINILSTVPSFRGRTYRHTCWR